MKIIKISEDEDSVEEIKKKHINKQAIIFFPIYNNMKTHHIHRAQFF